MTRIFSVILPVINSMMDHLEALEGSDQCEFIVVDGTPDGNTIKAVIGHDVYCMKSPQGRARQMNAGAAAAKGEILIFLHAVILVGGDIPDMMGEIVKEGFAALKSSDVVIGPSHDGGYYLIGFKSGTFVPEGFTGISWGTDGVLKSTREILENKGLRLSFLPLWRDIDTYEDLTALI